ncbi:MAG: transglutaminase-like domain-containing protein [Luteolibacter sp.]
MNVSPPDTKEIEALLRLLDDETPEVRSVVSGRFAEVGGDISEILPGMAQNLDDQERRLLADMLQPSRRHTLREDWLTPRFGSASLEDDWELFESHLRLLSDFLHDGVSLRQPLSDALDLLADEAREDGVISEDDLRVFLFEGKRLKGNGDNYYDPRNSDLSWCIAESKSNPIGLGVIFMLVGKRLDMEIEGICFPGHFLCRIHEDGYSLVVDCFDKGRTHSQQVLTDSSNELSPEQRQSLKRSSDLGMILIRILNNLVDSFGRLGRTEDALLVTEMRDSMAKASGKSV